MKVRQFLMVVSGLLISGVASAGEDLKTVSYVEPAKYVGTWYQIARKPVIFEAGCVCSRQVLSVNASDANVVDVYNSCNNISPTGRVREIRGEATNVDAASNSKFKVDFGLPWKGDYWIIGLDSDYRYAVVSDPARRSLYVLSRTPTLEPALYEKAIAEVADQVDVTSLVMTQQEGCSYP